MFRPEYFLVLWAMLLGLLVIVDAIMEVFGIGWHKNEELKKEKKEKKMKLWNKKSKLTATDDLIDFILLKLYEDPGGWEHTKCGSTYWWEYKGVIYVGHTNRGQVYNGSIKIAVSEKQSKKITAATNNLISAQALHKMMKVAVKNVT